MSSIFESAMRSKVTIVLDENLRQLRAALEDSGFRVLEFKSGTKDPDLIPHLTGRAILTKNTEDFKIDAVIHDFDIISIENIAFVDNKKDRSNETAKKIAHAVRHSGFTSKRGNWLLSIMNDGKWSLSELL